MCFEVVVCLGCDGGFTISTRKKLYVGTLLKRAFIGYLHKQGYIEN